MKQYLFDTSHIQLIAMCIKQQAVRKFVLAQNVTKRRDTFTFMSHFFGSFLSFFFFFVLWKFVQESKKGLCILKHYRCNSGRLFDLSFVYILLHSMHSMSLHNHKFRKSWSWLIERLVPRFVHVSVFECLTNKIQASCEKNGRSATL